MNLPAPHVTSPLWDAMGWTMLHVLWLGGTIWLLALLGRISLRRASPQVRYGFALACLLLLLATPFVLAAVALGLPAPGHAPGLPNAASSTTLAGPGLLDQLGPLHAGAGGHAVAGTLARYLPWLWLAGTPVTAVLLLTGMLGVWRLRRSHELRDAPSSLVARSARLAYGLGIRREVGLALCDKLAAPVLLGIVRPLIVLPPALLAGLTPTQLEMVLLHELTHVARRDNLVILVQRVAESLLFFHPAVWWLSHWMRLERERCCDERVLAATGNPQAYVRTLLSVVGGPGFDGARGNRQLELGSAMAAHDLPHRVRSILAPKEPAMRVRSRLGGLSATFLLGVALFVTAPVARPTVAPTHDTCSTAHHCCCCAAQAHQGNSGVATAPAFAPSPLPPAPPRAPRAALPAQPPSPPQPAPDGAYFVRPRGAAPSPAPGSTRQRWLVRPGDARLPLRFAPRTDAPNGTRWFVPATPSTPRAPGAQAVEDAPAPDAASEPTITFVTPDGGWVTSPTPRDGGFANVLPENVVAPIAPVDPADVFVEVDSTRQPWPTDMWSYSVVQPGATDPEPVEVEWAPGTYRVTVTPDGHAWRVESRDAASETTSEPADEPAEAFVEEPAPEPAPTTAWLPVLLDSRLRPAHPAYPRKNGVLRTEQHPMWLRGPAPEAADSRDAPRPPARQRIRA